MELNGFFKKRVEDYWVYQDESCFQQSLKFRLPNTNDFGYNTLLGIIKEWSWMANKIEKKLLSLYDDLNLGLCDVCQKCKDDNPDLYSKAVGCWFVGNVYDEQKKKILFIGKNARGMPAKDYEENQNKKGVLDEFRYARDNLWNKSWPYWSYTRSICKELFGSLGMEAVAFTNMVKCNGSDTVDTTTESMKEYCIKELGVVRKEIELIVPTHIVCYTHTHYDNWLPFLFDKSSCLNSAHKAIGRKKMPYAEYECVLGNSNIKVLRVGHPERMLKEDFVSSIVDWLKNN